MGIFDTRSMERFKIWCKSLYSLEKVHNDGDQISNGSNSNSDMMMNGGSHHHQKEYNNSNEGKMSILSKSQSKKVAMVDKEEVMRRLSRSEKNMDMTRDGCGGSEKPLRKTTSELSQLKKRNTKIFEKPTEVSYYYYYSNNAFYFSC